MNYLTEKALFNCVNYSVNDDDVISFINSDQCTVQMVNYEDNNGVTPLLLVAEKSRYSVVKALLNKGANVYHASRINSANALVSAISDINVDGSEDQNNQLKTIELLTEGKKPLSYLNEGFTFACEINQTQVVKKLLNDVSYSDEVLEIGMKHLLVHENEEAIQAINSIILYRKLQNELNSSLMLNKKVKI